LDGSGVSDTLQIQVLEGYVAVHEIYIYSESGETEVNVEESIQLLADVFPFDATNREIIWTISKSSSGEAAVTQNGLLSGISLGTVKVVAFATDGSGVNCPLEITVSDHTGINELQRRDVRIYPNPGKGLFYLDHADNPIKLIQIFNVDGSVIMELIPGPGSPIFCIDMQSYPAGPYFMKIFSRNELYIKRVIKLQ